MLEVYSGWCTAPGREVGLLVALRDPQRAPEAMDDQAARSDLAIEFAQRRAPLLGQVLQAMELGVQRRQRDGTNLQGR